jgi:DNA-binding beta-propeller fold protein YncE
MMAGPAGRGRLVTVLAITAAFAFLAGPAALAAPVALAAPMALAGPAKLATPARTATALAGLPDSATIRVGGHPTGIAVDGHAGFVWIADGDHVTEIRESTRAVIGTFKLAPGLSSLIVDPDTRTVWVTNTSSGTVTELYEDTGTVAQTIDLAKGITAICTVPAGDLYIINPVQDTFTDIYLVNGVSVRIHDLPAGLTPTGDAGLWVVGDQQVYSYDFSVDSQLVQAPDVLTGAAVNPNLTPGSDLSVISADPANPDSGALYLLGLDNGDKIGEIPLRFSPDAITIDTANHAWVTSGTADKVMLVNLSTETVARTLPTGADPVAVAVDQASGTVWIANHKDGTVTMYHYYRPRFTTRPLVRAKAGQSLKYVVRANGFPVPVMELTGKLPAGLRSRGGLRRLVITGTPRQSAAHHSYRVTVMAANGIGTVTQQLVIKVS